MTVIPADQSGKGFGIFSLCTIVAFALMPPLLETLLTVVPSTGTAYAWIAVLTLPALVDIVRRTHVVYAAAMDDDSAFIRATRDMVRDGKARLGLFCEKMKLECQYGEGNFVMIHVPFSDSLLYRKLMRQGMMVRTMTGFRFPNWIRVSLVPADIMEEFCHVLRRTLGTEYRPTRT